MMFNACVYLFIKVAWPDFRKNKLFIFLQNDFEKVMVFQNGKHTISFKRTYLLFTNISVHATDNAQNTLQYK